MITDAEIIGEAIRMVESGVQVTFPVKGRSMLPFIVGGSESVVLARPENICVGHIVLAFTESADGQNADARTNTYVIHRITSIDGDKVTLMGDGNIIAHEYCSLKNVKALATHFARNSELSKGVNVAACGKPLYARHRQAAAWLWGRLLPFRKWLLLSYRVVNKILSFTKSS